MPLTDTDHPVHNTLNGAGFATTDADKIVGVVVTHEALDDIESPPPANGEYVSRCESYRSKFLAIASEKYDAGETENEGRRVRITTADISN